MRHAASLAASGLAATALAVAVLAPTREPMPDDRLTPGAVLPGVGRDQTCDPAWTHQSRAVPDSMKVAVFRAYGLAPTPAVRAAYEIDHRVPVALGGESSPRNLWPQPWDGPTGAKAKDRVEAALYRAVCSGRMPLAAAQAVFLGDWRRAAAGPPPTGRIEAR